MQKYIFLIYIQEKHVPIGYYAYCITDLEEKIAFILNPYNYLAISE